MLSRIATIIEEKTGFSVSPSFDGFLDFSIFSPAGQDFHINVKEGETLYKLYQNLNDCRDGFDISSETYLWLDNTGHGKNGAPYEMIDVYKDMEWCAEKIEELIYCIYELDKEEKETCV